MGRCDPHPRDSRLVSNVEKYHRQTWDARDEGWVGNGDRRACGLGEGWVVGLEGHSLRKSPGGGKLRLGGRRGCVGVPAWAQGSINTGHFEITTMEVAHTCGSQHSKEVERQEGYWFGANLGYM